ncbi:50S ribosomal protein L24 [bacterium]|nr:50S ribosomal protein L24 [candidate division CSSED10-310 bacterium]
MKKTSNKLAIKREDQVKVLTGKEVGKTGKVLKIIPQKQRAIVEGINFIKKAERPSQRMQKGGIVEKEAPVHLSNLMVICKHCNKPTRIGRTKVDDGFSVRVCKKCGEIIDK